jgi:AcrR family transcriptional regulator
MSATRSRIVDAAAELFHRRGFHATSLAAVQQEAGVRGGSLYYFFKTKEQLLEATLERYAEILDPVIMEPAFDGVHDPIERIFRVLAWYRSTLLENDLALGCPIGNLAIEMADAGPGVRRRIGSDLSLWASRIESALDEAAEQLPDEVDRGRLAVFVLTNMEGAVLLARGHRRIEPFDNMVALLRDYFDRLLEAGGRSGRTSDHPR